MEEIREALRDGLREEAAPIARRLAEVKGLSNNAIRRLERIESTIESERNARIDDLALLVDLLTEGWRAMNARLDRIEAALERCRDERRAAARERLALSSRAGRTSSNREPLPTLRAQVDPPAERSRELLRDREAEARAAADVRDERPEEPLAALRRDARAGVLDRDVDRAVLLRELERDPAAVGRRVERVREQVADDLQHAVAVGGDHRPVAHLAGGSRSSAAAPLRDSDS